jgi:sugar (pentulose or hexulose) kinase
VAVPEGAALGSAFMARCTAGLERSENPFGANMTDARRWARTARRIEPAEASAAPVAERYRRFGELTAAAISGGG